MNGERPLLLSSGKVEHYSAAFYLRNPLADGLPQDSLAIVRERLVGRRHARPDRRPERLDGAGLVRARGRGGERLRGHLCRQGARLRARRPDAMPRRCPTRSSRVSTAVRSSSSTRRRAARRRTSGSRSSATSAAASSATGSSSARASAGSSTAVVHPRTNGHGAGVAAPRGAALEGAAPAVGGDLGCTAALVRALGRRPGGAANARRQRRSARLPAAGMPWFMTVFGRDTMITSYQTLLLGPDLARGALDVLAELQATEDDPSIDAEPGKIVHEVRRGKAAADVVPPLLRDGRRDAALPRVAVRGVALDRRRRVRRAAARARAAPRSAGSTIALF